MAEPIIHTSTRQRPFVWAAILAGLLLYGLTCAPGVLWQDSATFQFRVHQTDLQGELGLALSHPLYILLAKAFTLLPIGGVAFRVNLFSGFCAAACLGLVMTLLLSVTRSTPAAIIGTLLLAVSHTFWRHAVIAEVYTLYALGLAAELVLVERFFSRRQSQWLILALLVCGLNASNHLMALLHIPAYAATALIAWRYQRLSVRMVLFLPLAFIVGAAPYLVLILADLVRGQPVADTIESALFGVQFQDSVLNTSFSFGTQAARSLQYFALNFPTPLILVAPIAIWSAFQNARCRGIAAFAGGIFVVSFVFAFRYRVPDQYVFFMPCYVLMPVFVAIALASWLDRSRTRQVVCLLLALLPAVVYEIAPPLLKQSGIAIGSKREIPLRDSYTYFIRPRKNSEDSAGRFARAALDLAAPAGLLIADSTIMNALVFVRDVEGLQPTVTLTATANTTPADPAISLKPEAIEPFVKRKAAYLCTDAPNYVPNWVLDDYDRVTIGTVFRLEQKEAAGSRSSYNPDG